MQTIETYMMRLAIQYATYLREWLKPSFVFAVHKIVIRKTKFCTTGNDVGTYQAQVWTTIWIPPSDRRRSLVQNKTTHII